jgi:endonuclease/exonuclease/phosphatase family metal-dependent hydrolase
MDEFETGSFLRAAFPCKWPEAVRLVSWNINRGIQLNRVIEFLLHSSADLILLQETDVNTRRTGRCNVPRTIARALQMNYVFGIEFEELGQGSQGLPAYHGQTTLSRFPISHCRILRFHQQSTFWRPRWYIPPLKSFQRRLGARMALICDVTAADRTSTFYNLHLESRGNDHLRSAQLSEMLTDIRRSRAEEQVVVAGDFNFDISRPPAATLVSSTQLDNPFVHLGRRPTARNWHHATRGAIDWILTGRAVSAINPQISDSVDASDHDPLSLQLRFL